MKLLPVKQLLHLVGDADRHTVVAANGGVE